MFGFVRKREVEELRRQVDSLCMTILADRVNGKERICKVREECLNYTQKIDNFHSEHIELILRHLGLRLIPRSTQTTTTTTPARLIPDKPPAKANKRAAKKAKSGDEDGE